MSISAAETSISPWAIFRHFSCYSEPGVKAMIYQLNPQPNTTNIYTTPFNSSRIPCLTTKEIRAFYPHGNFVIVGEIGSLARPPDGRDTLLAGGSEIPILPRGSLIWPFEWIAGYVPIGENTYVAVVGSPFLSFLRYKRKLVGNRSEEGRHVSDGLRTKY